MAAQPGRGRSVLANVAREPEISDLADCLGGMGAGSRASAPTG